MDLFFEACQYGDYDVVKKRIRQEGFDLYDKDFNGRTGFHLACEHENINIVHLLLDFGYDFDFEFDNQVSGFHLACRNNNFHVVKTLIDRGFDMNHSFLIACEEGNTTVLKMLISKGIKNIVNINGFEIACENGHVNVVKFLLTKGFNVYNIGEWSDTFCYHVACENGHVDVVKYLIEEGFCVNTKDHDNLTGFDYAIKRNDCKGVVEILLEKGFDIEYAFEIACREENVGIITTIIDHKNFNIYTTSKYDGLTAFHVACLHGGNIEIIKILISKGSNQNQCSVTGFTGFALACFEGYLETCLYLIKIGVYVDIEIIQNYGINSIPCYCINCLYKIRRSGKEIINDRLLVLEAYIRETNWRRRYYFAIFLNGSNFLESDRKYNNISKITIQEKVLSLRPIYENITSFL